MRLLIAWNAAINLTAVRDPAAIALRHVIDSLTAAPVLSARGERRLLDLGSGGGFPGLPLAVALDAEARLVDSVGKKARFLEVACEALGLAPRVAADARRAEALAVDPAHREAWPVVTARAVAPLAELVELALPLLVVGGVLVAWKRGDLEGAGAGDLPAEIDAARRAGDALGGVDLEVITPARDALPGHRLIVVTKRRPTGPGWPRDPAARRRGPWSPPLLG